MSIRINTQNLVYAIKIEEIWEQTANLKSLTIWPKK